MTIGKIPEVRETEMSKMKLRLQTWVSGRMIVPVTEIGMFGRGKGLGGKRINADGYFRDAEFKMLMESQYRDFYKEGREGGRTQAFIKLL